MSLIILLIINKVTRLRSQSSSQQYYDHIHLTAIKTDHI